MVRLTRVFVIPILISAVVGALPLAAASCTAPSGVRSAPADWWLNRLAALAGDRPAPPVGLYVSSWTLGRYSLVWAPGPAFLPESPAERWELSVDRGPWIPYDVQRLDRGTTSVLFMSVESPPPDDGALLSVRGVSAAGPGPATTIEVNLPLRLDPVDSDRPSVSGGPALRSTVVGPGW